jgi:hypothetical protein
MLILGELQLMGVIIAGRTVISGEFPGTKDIAMGEAHQFKNKHQFNMYNSELFGHGLCESRAEGWHAIKGADTC